MQRGSGPAAVRCPGRARYISLRGAPNYWTTLSFDGINVVSPEGRDARYDSIPLAFDYPGFHAAGKLGAGKAELGSRGEYEGSLVLSNRFKAGDGEIGILVSGTFYKRDMITDNFETDYERVAQDQRSTLRDFRQSIFTNTLEGTHKFGDGRTLGWLGNYTESKDDRSVVGEASWDSPTTRNLHPTVAHDFSDPNRSRLQLFTTIQLASPTRFQVAAGALGATEETDGVALALGYFGRSYPRGLLVVQDGQNAPRAQNFKLIDWRAVLRAVAPGR